MCSGSPSLCVQVQRCAIWCLGGRPVLPGVGGHLLVFHGEVWGPSHKAQGILGSTAPDFPLLSTAHPLSGARTLRHKGAHSLPPPSWCTEGRRASDPWIHKNSSFMFQDSLEGSHPGPEGAQAPPLGRLGTPSFRTAALKLPSLKTIEDIKELLCVLYVQPCE